MLIAPNYTHIAAGQTDSLIASGSSITVYGVSIQGTSAGEILIEEANGTTSIFEIIVPINGTAVLNIAFVAPRGIAVTTPAGTTCTVYHSNAT